MHVFLTGGSGYVGRALLTRLVADGHRVTALARSDAAAGLVGRAGAEVVRGDLTDLAVLRVSAVGADAVVHTAVDYTDPDMGPLEEKALDAMLGHGRFVYTSSTLVYGDTGDRRATEDTPVAADGVQPFKVDGERRVLAEGGLVLRPGLVFGDGGSSMIGGMLAGARESGAATYVGDGANAWSAVHVRDLVELYALVLTRPVETGVLNAVAHPAPTMLELATAVGQVTGTPAVSIPVERARETMGPFADQLTRPLVADSSRATALVGWRPQGPGLLEDVTTGSYAAR
ncbi:NAD-dependent epimerase/dehydratase family protein [Umezawaea sp. Da 62-37]|uniref:NAD-dependent epimerase/dehydratase family protein n=1 Tax=Umezawaea sp. Da 62-37 TaxID=3075927 RepID=UPI0028F6D538|nr:NAD-dependent epimerase/dehydratase family protein [Umezawaea sp. Da 62-37]WNV86045.1 NAD-dependent epimerase/dehydratase family protein [Umezawaea sp. Da 62-37]